MKNIIIIGCMFLASMLSAYAGSCDPDRPEIYCVMMEHIEKLQSFNRGEMRPLPSESECLYLEDVYYGMCHKNPVSGEWQVTGFYEEESPDLCIMNHLRNDESVVA